MNKNFSLNFYSSAQVVLHKCRLNRGQLHFARKTHSEWQIPKIYQRFDNDNHTIGVNVMISSKHMRAGRVIRERSGVSQQAITENNTPRPEHKHTQREEGERGLCVFRNKGTPRIHFFWCMLQNRGCCLINETGCLFLHKDACNDCLWVNKCPKVHR